MSGLEKKRIGFTVQYDGSSFYGWQLQREERSVQGEIERVLSRLFNRPARIVGAGRTDRGVHATGQVAAVDVPPRWSAPELRRAANALLPDDVWIARAAEVHSDFHPRYDALERAYVYRIGLADLASSPFHRSWCWPLRRPLDLERMQRAARSIVGDHSFRAFAKAGQEERGDRCIVSQAMWTKWEGLGLEFSICANRFLHHMVRYLVGTLVDIGLGRRSEDELAALLEGRRTLQTSPPAPPQGLFLSEVRYPAGSFDSGSSDNALPFRII